MASWRASCSGHGGSTAVAGSSLAFAELHGVGELGLNLLVGPLPITPVDHQVEGASEVGHLVAAAGLSRSPSWPSATQPAKFE